jgi:glutamine amidotransferase
MKVVIVHYGLGNVSSIKNMLSYLGFDAVISGDESTIKQADKLILPGVGAFDHGMTHIKEKNLLDVLNNKAQIEKKPILGICLGMQLMCSKSEEGVLGGLNWFDADVIRFPKGSKIRVPHMGWNSITIKKKSHLIDSDDDQAFYFVHSYHVSTKKTDDILFTTPYGNEFTSAIHRDNIYGVQFHPEKSHRYGMALLKNFMLNT